MDVSFLPSVGAGTATGPNEGDAAFAHTEAISWSPGAHPQGSHLGLLFVKENSRGGGSFWEPSSSWWAVAYRRT